jgi:hypothetical protein
MSTLDTLQQHGHEFRLGPDGKLLHRGPAMDVDELRRIAPAVKAELKAKQQHTAPIGANFTKKTRQIAQPRDLPAPAVSEHPRFRGRRRRAPEAWTAETRELIAWFRTTSPPDEPFDTPAGLTVSDPRRYWRFLTEWIDDGADSPHPGLTANLRQLRTIWEERDHG